MNKKNFIIELFAKLTLLLFCRKISLGKSQREIQSIKLLFYLFGGLYDID